MTARKKEKTYGVRPGERVIVSNKRVLFQHPFLPPTPQPPALALEPNVPVILDAGIAADVAEHNAVRFADDVERATLPTIVDASSHKWFEWLNGRKPRESAYHQ